MAEMEPRAGEIMTVGEASRVMVERGYYLDPDRSSEILHVFRRETPNEQGSVFVIGGPTDLFIPQRLISGFLGRRTTDADLVTALSQQNQQAL